MPLINDINNVVQFIQFLKLLIDISMDKNKEEIDKNITENNLCIPTKQDLKDFRKFNNISSDVEVRVESGSNIFIKCNFYNKDKSIMNNNLDKMINEENKDINIYTKQLFIWEQANFKSNKQGNKGKIEAISKESLKIIFDKNEYKNEMTNKERWQYKCYIVDVEALTINNIPKVYKILKNYNEDTFDLES